MTLPPDPELLAEFANDPVLQELAALEQSAFHQWRPRRDDPGRFDQQASFVESKAPGVAILCGGNGTGTT